MMDTKRVGGVTAVPLGKKSVRDGACESESGDGARGDANISLLAVVHAVLFRLWDALCAVFLVPAHWVYERHLSAAARHWRIPRHVGLIMDGNRRYARLRGMSSPAAGHERGAEKLQEVLEWCFESGVRVLTVWALSVDNVRSRGEEELEELFAVCVRELARLAESDAVVQNRVRVRFFGRRSLVPENVRRAMAEAERKTEGHDQYFLNVALAYGGREEIADAVKGHMRSVIAGVRGSADPSLGAVEAAVDRLEPADLGMQLYTSGVPEPDFIIRTSGEMRIGGFLMWQSAYSEFYFCDALWPAFRKIDFLRALRSYSRRKRRYGK